MPVVTKHIAVGLDKQTAYIETHVDQRVQDRENITDSFKRAVVLFASEDNTFSVDGMTFRVTCERIQ